MLAGPSQELQAFINATVFLKRNGLLLNFGQITLPDWLNLKAKELRESDEIVVLTGEMSRFYCMIYPRSL